MSKHEQYLKECFKLAKLGESLAFPNPIVGSLIVHNDEIIARGFHKRYGEAHAELNAVNDAPNDLLSESSIYVSLEPCAHHGKTPPCADLIIKHKFKELIYACSDPNPQVSGQGIERIKAAGIKVTGPEDLDPKIVQEAQYINRHFLKLVTPKQGRGGWLTLKIATTEDGRMITDPNEPRYITNSNSRKQVHRLRSCHQLLITGINTIKKDDPLLNIRHKPEDLGLGNIKNPDIAILKSSQDFTEDERNKLQVFQNPEQLKRKIMEFTIGDDFKNLEEFIEAMNEKGYQKIMIEAGPKLSEAFLNTNLVDEVIHYQALHNKESNNEAIQIAEKLSQKYGALNTKSRIIENQKDENKDIEIIMQLEEQAVLH